MMFLIKFASFVLCLGILAFGGYKTVEGIQLDEMMDEIASVMEDASIFPPTNLPEGDDPDSPGHDNPVNPPSTDEEVGGESGGSDNPEQSPESNPNPNPNPGTDDADLSLWFILLAVSLAGRARVNSISPGWIDTAYTLYEGPDATQQPAGRVGNPMDIANMVLFLCSDKAGFITGENICIDGGMTRQMIYHGDCGWKLEK